MRANYLSVILGVVFLLGTSAAWALTPKAVYKKSGPAVVLVLGSDDGKAGSAGTGSIITSEGKIVTNAHVVINSAGKPYRILYVFLKPPRLTGDNTKDLTNRYKAEVLRYSAADKLDLALLQIENPPPNLPTIQFGDPTAVEIGDSAIAIGHPEQGGLWTLTTGAVSSMIANFSRVKGKHVFQTEASVNRGNSGGPLLDEQGHMIGINTCIARRGAGGVTITDVNFALKSSVAVEWLSGQGMGLAYASPKKANQVIVAAPPAQSVEPKPTEPAPSVPVREAPAATIVVNDRKAPQTVAQAQQRAEKVKAQAKQTGEGQASEKLEKGKRQDAKKPPEPRYHTEKRPMSLAEIRRQQMKELEDMMGEMRGKIRKKSGRGMGLW